MREVTEMKNPPTIRQRRVAELVKEELAVLLELEVADPRLQFVNVTAVEITPDLRLAKVYVTTLDEEEEYPEVLAALEHARGFLRSSLASRIRLRRVPDLAFYVDDVLSKARRIDALLEQIRKEKETGGEPLPVGSDGM